MTRFRLTLSLHQLRRESENAFTLTELILSMVVVGIVIVFMISVVQRGMHSSDQVRNISNLRSLGLAAIRYANDHNGMLPLDTQLSGKKQTTCRYGAGSGAAPLKLLDRSDYAFAQGDKTYVDNLNVFYSPFARRMRKERQRDTFHYRSGGGYYIGYIAISLPRRNEANPDVPLLVPNLHNEHLLDSPRAPLYCDFRGPIAEEELFSSDQCAFVAVDGSVNIFSQKELAGTWANALKKMAGLP